MPDTQNGSNLRIAIPPKMMWIIIAAVFSAAGVGSYGTKLIEDKKQVTLSAQDHEIFDNKLQDLLSRINNLSLRLWTLQGKIDDLDSKLNEVTSTNERRQQSDNNRVNRLQQQVDRLQAIDEQRHRR